ncbi:MAG: M4 family metallopeptidase [Salibacteraceae bacterium]
MLTLIVSNVKSQDTAYVDSLKQAIFLKIDSSGVFYAKPGTLLPGQALDEYKYVFYNNYFDRAELIDSWHDSVTGMNHNKYQQYFDGVPVEGALIIEHVLPNGFVSYINGKVANFSDLQNLPTTLTAQNAWDDLVALGTFQNHILAYEFDNMEQQIRTDMADSNATYYPVSNAELVMSITSFKNYGYRIPLENYRPAWRFDVMGLSPFFHRAYYVDAENGELLHTLELTRSDGPATIWYYGTQTIDTRERGFPYFNHLLNANSDGRNFETRYFNFDWQSWGGAHKIKDNDDDWGTNHHGATATHWYAMQSWDYFNEIHGRNGVDGEAIEIRIYADDENFNNARHYKTGGKHYLRFGIFEDVNYPGRAIDIVGHEIAHGVNVETANLIYYSEPGAIDESFADIFGYLIERYTEGPGADWIVSADQPGLGTRSFEDPHSAGLYYTNPQDNCFDTDVGQPEYYHGEFWCDCECDFGGVHVNSGVVNKWFWMLANGETGINEDDENYSVSPININDAGDIVYYALTNLLTPASLFTDARQATINAAIDLFGECSNQQIQVENAWFAVGVGNESTCAPMNLDHAENASESFHVFPNPTNGLVTITSTQKTRMKIEVYDMRGVNWKTINEHGSHFNLSLENLPDGMYVIQISSEKSTQNQVIVKTQ